MSTPKLVNFHHFLDFQEFEKKHVNTKTSQFLPFFGFQDFEKKHVNTKTSQFSPFFGFQEFEKIDSFGQNIVNFLNCWTPGIWEKHVNTKTSEN